MKIITDFFKNITEQISFLNQHNMGILKNIFDLSQQEKRTDEDEKTLQEKIKTATILFLEITILNHNTEKQIEFIKEFNNLMIKYNKNEEIKQKLLFINRIINEELTIKESQKLSSEVLQHLMQINNWVPPTISISKHYFDVLNEE